MGKTLIAPVPFLLFAIIVNGISDPPLLWQRRRRRITVAESPLAAFCGARVGVATVYDALWLTFRVALPLVVSRVVLTRKVHFLLKPGAGRVTNALVLIGT